MTDEDLARLQRDTFKYFADEVNPENGLVRDSTRRGSPSSIAAVGFRGGWLENPVSSV